MDIFLEQMVELLKSGGWVGATIFGIYLLYKTAMTSLVAVTIYKAIKLIVQAFSNKTFEARVAAELGTKAPLTPLEDSKVMKAIRENCKLGE